MQPLPLPYLQFIFGVAQNFVHLLLNCISHMVIKGMLIWGVRQPDVKIDVLTYFVTVNTRFSYLYGMANSPVSRPMVFRMPPSQSKAALQALDVTSMLSLRPYGKMNGSITSPLTPWYRLDEYESTLGLTPKYSKIFILDCLEWMPCCIACHF